MEFRYYYLLQDLVGLLLIFLYSRMMFLSIKLFLSKGIKMGRVRLFLSQIVFVSLGIYLCLNRWSIKTIIVSIILATIGIMMQKKK